MEARVPRWLKCRNVWVSLIDLHLSKPSQGLIGNLGISYSCQARCVYMGFHSPRCWFLMGYSTGAGLLSSIVAVNSGHCRPAGCSPKFYRHSSPPKPWKGNGPSCSARRTISKCHDQEVL